MSNPETILEELRLREPVFHHPEHGRTRHEIERYVDEKFYEIGASGEHYDREFVLREVERRYQDDHYQGIHAWPENAWTMKDFRCMEIAEKCFLITYVLTQNDRITQRASIWRKKAGSWKILYHQGTVV